HGLGLAAILGIVRSHNGTLTVESELGVGTTFKLIFPVCWEELAPSTTHLPDITSDFTASTLGTVLVIDDEINVRETVQDMLELSGYSVMLADGGQKGIDCYQAQQGKIDTVLLDLTMPGMSGEETFTQLRKLDPQARIIISSGHSRQQIATMFADQTRPEFLPKPYNFEQLMQIVAV
ncbi:MAG: response regulator, partial [Candidatus Promineifilaceae bacterium]